MPCSGRELELEEALQLRERAIAVGYAVAMIDRVSCGQVPRRRPRPPGTHERSRQGGCPRQGCVSGSSPAETAPWSIRLRRACRASRRVSSVATRRKTMLGFQPPAVGRRGGRGRRRPWRLGWLTAGPSAALLKSGSARTAAAHMLAVVSGTAALRSRCRARDRPRRRGRHLADHMALDGERHRRASARGPSSGTCARAIDLDPERCRSRRREDEGRPARPPRRAALRPRRDPRARAPRRRGCRPRRREPLPRPQARRRSPTRPASRSTRRRTSPPARAGSSRRTATTSRGEI